MNGLDTREAGVVRGAVVLGRLVGVVASAALVGQAAVWLCVGDPALRVTLTWWCAGALLLCFVALLLFRASSPVKDAESAYRAAWGLRVGGARSAWWQALLAALIGPAYVALLVGLGASALQEAGDAKELASSGARIVAVPVEAVEPGGKTGKGRYDDYRAVYEVSLPESGVGGADTSDGRSVRVEVLSSEYLSEGDTLYVAYAPDDLELQPVADEERTQLKQELEGLALSFRAWVAVLLVWGAGTVWLVIRAVRSAAGARTGAPAGSLSAVPAVVDGHVQHATTPQGRPGLMLRGDGLEIPFEPANGSAKTAASTLHGQQGRLEWMPVGNDGQNAATPADFVGVDGRRLQGAVATAKVRELEARGHVSPAPAPATSVGADVVDFGATWPLATRLDVMCLFFLAYALLIPLYVLPHSGGWGVACAVASAVITGATFLYHWNRSE